MPKNLLIVESPAKAKTIEKILGADFTVKSSYGHVRDLEKNNDAVDVENDYRPKYIIPSEKKKVVKELKEWVKKVDEVWLATDEDREGEAISWHLKEVLGLDDNTKRIVFREITPPAIKKAIQNPRKVDLNLVNAQQARRILDRLVGYELSELLWRKIKGKLSAGRVQSVAVKLIVDREREIMGHEAETYYNVQAEFTAEDKKDLFKAKLNEKLSEESGAFELLEKCNGSTFKVTDIQKKPSQRNPAPPFTTSTLQQEASRKLGFSVKRTMSVAQKLYEAGLITYMRTDSTNLSETAINSISQYVESEFGKRYAHPRRYSLKKKLAQEAHEAIRPTYIQNTLVTGSKEMERLYDLIWKRTIASQMASAELEKTVVNISISKDKEHYFIAQGEVIKFDGFLKVYLESTDDDNQEEQSGMLPVLKEGQILISDEISAIQRFTSPPPRYTEAGLVKKLEELGIGRPSTYAPTISKIMEENRGYITKESRPGEEREYLMMILKDGKIKKKKKTEITGTTKNRLYSSDIGMVVVDFLNSHFDQVMDYGFTADMEEKFDDIAGGTKDWVKILDEFYNPFHQVVEATIEKAKRFTGERDLGADPESGKRVLAKISRKGQPMIQIGATDELEEDEKPRFANLKYDQSIESITLVEALKLFELPRLLGEYEGLPVEVNTGRYGPYVKHGDDYISLGRKQDPFECTLEKAVELIQLKKEENRPITTYHGKPVTRGKGRFGPYLKWNEMYVNIPKKYAPEELTRDECVELIEAKVEKEKNRYIHNWPDASVSVQNGRWGPYIKYKKSNFKIPKNAEGKKYTDEEIQAFTLDDVKKIIQAQAPGTFKENKKKAKKTK